VRVFFYSNFIMYDYIIVGSGLAGICFAETASTNGKRILVFNDNSQNSSYVAAGLYNPVILKRFTEVWQSKEQLKLADEFYSQLEQKLNAKIDIKIPLLRKYFSIEEQNNWFTASDKPGLTDYLSTAIINKKYNSIDSPYGYGEVLQTGYVDTSILIDFYINYLSENNSYKNESFQHNEIIFHDDFVQYKNSKARHIVFAEGFGMLLNPFFNSLPLDGAKGELLLIKAPDLNLDVIIKTSIFIMPIGKDLYKVGATYNWTDKTNTPTQEGKEELLKELRDLIQCDFEVLDHYAGVRPTVKDRKPMLGTHPIYKNLHLLNGLGTRGVMLAPSMAKMLFEYIEHQVALDSYVNINRFKNGFSNLYQSERKD
jgi:glycine oxidase